MAHGCNFDTPNLDILSGVTPSKCSSLCSANDLCTHYTWMSYDGGYCFLKSGIVNKSMSIGTNNNNIICGLQSSITTTTSTITTTILPFYGVQNNVARSQLNEYTIVYYNKI